MDELINEIAMTMENRSDATIEVERVLDEIERKSGENDYLKSRLVKWNEVGENQYHQWNLEIGNFLIRFDLNDVINNIEKEKDEAGFPIPNDKIEVDKIENAIKKIILSSIKVS